MLISTVIGNFKKLVRNIFHKEKFVLYYENLQPYERLVLRLKNTPCIRIQSITRAKIIYQIQHTRKNRRGRK